MRRRTMLAVICATAILSAVILPTMTSAQTNPFTKAQVGDRIRKVEDGVDEFQKYLENRGEDASNRASSAQSSGATTRRKSANSANTDARRNQAKQTKDDLEDAMDDLNRSTNRLRRKFDPTSNYLERKVQMEQVMDSARRVNQVMTKGNYGTQAARYWGALRTNINDLARCYSLTPMGA
jgi:peptidoglycan hydrolase CwlO-like protein